jgi:hypothetical protein
MALDISTELYLYSWPLVMTFLTRKSMFYCPDNRMMPLPVFPNPNLTAIVKPNVDTLYDACWIDHTKADDLLLSIPNTEDGLYFLFPLMDAWTNIVESPGWRTTGKEETKVLIRGPFASSPEPDPSLYDLIIHSPTTMTYLLGRTNVANQSDLRPTQEQLFSYEFGPLNQRSTSASPAAAGFTSDLTLSKKNTVDEIFAMSPREYYELFTRLLVENPPIFPQDDDIVRRMGEEFGMFPGQPWSYSSLSPKQREELSFGMTSGASLMYSYPTETANGWTLPNMATGNFSSDYSLRAYIALVLYAANVPQDAVYYNSELFTGGAENVYVVEFNQASGGPPPTNEFWSMTMYTEEGYLVPNENAKYSISSQQEDLKVTEDGSVHITISVNQPASLESTNWLPAPQNHENFMLTLRVYWPQDAVLDHTWVPPRVTLQSS